MTAHVAILASAAGLHCRFRAAYPVRQTPRWSVRRRTDSHRTVIYDAEHSTHFRLPWQSDHLRALRPTIAVADGSVGVRELTHEWRRRFGSLFATGYGNYFQISSRQPEDRRHAQFVDQERKDV